MWSILFYVLSSSAAINQVTLPACGVNSCKYLGQARAGFGPPQRFLAVRGLIVALAATRAGTIPTGFYPELGFAQIVTSCDRGAWEHRTIARDDGVHWVSGLDPDRPLYLERQALDVGMSLVTVIEAPRVTFALTLDEGRVKRETYGYTRDACAFVYRN